MVPPHPALGPARVLFYEVPQRVTTLTHLAHRVNGFDLTAVQSLQPRLTVVGDLTALDLDTDNARALNGDDEVDLVILEAIGDPLAGDHKVTIAELVDQSGPDTPLGVIGHTGVIGQRDGYIDPSPAYRRSLR